jgi:hypothetical protein
VTPIWSISRFEVTLKAQESEYQDLIEKVAEKVVSWRLTVPAIVFLESTKPLSFVASQALVFFDPIVRSLFSWKDYERFYTMLEDRANIELLIREIERRESEG